MARPLKEKFAALPAERRRRVEARAAELIGEETSLRKLRKALEQTRSKIAADLSVDQETVFRYERRCDMLLSTLRHCIEKKGGELVLAAGFPNRKALRLRGFADITDQVNFRSPVAASLRSQTRAQGSRRLRRACPAS